MKYILKNKFIIAIAILFLASCGNKKIENKSDATHTETNSAEVKLSEEQQKAIGLQLGFMQMRNLKTALKVNGKLMLPPQNQAQVSLLIGGIVKDIFVKEGALVSQGQTLATIQNTEFIQLQQDYLQSSSNLVYLKAEFERQKSLQQENINAGKTFQKAEADYKFEISNFNSLKQKLKLYNVTAENLTAENISSTFNVVAPIAGNIHTISI
ncbi:MAG: biotin/lipoyl-binding protein, partial [Chitinophagaceae bacterium]